MDDDYEMDLYGDKAKSKDSNMNENSNKTSAKNDSPALNPFATMFTRPTMQPVNPFLPSAYEMQLQQQMQIQMQMQMQQMRMQMQQSQDTTRQKRQGKSSAKDLESVRIWCPRCKENTHKLLNCTNCATDGFMDGCPRCNVLDHQLFNCPVPFGKYDKYHYTRICRRGRPPWRMNRDDHRDYRKIQYGIDVSDPDDVPWTAEFAKKNIGKNLPRMIDPAWKDYDNVPRQVSEYEGYKLPPSESRWVWDNSRFNTSPKKPSVFVPRPVTQQQEQKSSGGQAAAFQQARDNLKQYTESFYAEDEGPGATKNPEDDEYEGYPHKDKLTSLWRQDQDNMRRIMQPLTAAQQIPAASVASSRIEFSVKRGEETFHMVVGEADSPRTTDQPHPITSSSLLNFRGHKHSLSGSPLSGNHENKRLRQSEGVNSTREWGYSDIPDHFEAEQDIMDVDDRQKHSNFQETSERGPAASEHMTKDKAQKGPPTSGYLSRDREQEKRRGSPVSNDLPRDTSRRGGPVSGYLSRGREQEEQRGPLVSNQPRDTSRRGGPVSGYLSRGREQEEQRGPPVSNDLPRDTSRRGGPISGYLSRERDKEEKKRGPPVSNQPRDTSRRGGPISGYLSRERDQEERRGPPVSLLSNADDRGVEHTGPNKYPAGMMGTHGVYKICLRCGGSDHLSFQKVCPQHPRNKE